MDDVLGIIGLCLMYLAMVFIQLLVVMIAVVFLGRNAVITRKHIFLAAGVGIIYLAENVIANIMFPDGLDSDTLMTINMVTTTILTIYAFVFFLLIYKEKRFLRAIESTICYYLLELYISTLAQITVVYFAGGTEEKFVEIFIDGISQSKEWTAISILIFILTSGLIAIIYFGFYRQHKQFIISIPYRILFVVWLVLMTIIPFIPAVLPGEEITFEQRYYAMSVLFGAGAMLLGLVVPLAVIILTTERTMAEKNKYQESYLMAELEYIEQYKRKQVETRAFRHDIINNLSMTQMMLEEGHIDEAKEHIGDMLGNVKGFSPRYITGDEMLDLIVSMKADKMEEKNIAFSSDGVIDGGLKIKPMDMCSIFANALDNAIEAASKCPAPSVTLNIKRTNTFFIIKITNTALAKVDVEKLMSSSGYTTKKDTEHHGFGLLNIRTAVEKYNGMLKGESDDNSFSLSIMVPRANG